MKKSRQLEVDCGAAVGSFVDKRDDEGGGQKYCGFVCLCISLQVCRILTTTREERKEEERKKRHKTKNRKTNPKTFSSLASSGPVPLTNQAQQHQDSLSKDHLLPPSSFTRLSTTPYSKLSCTKPSTSDHNRAIHYIHQSSGSGFLPRCLIGDIIQDHRVLAYRLLLTGWELF